MRRVAFRQLTCLSLSATARHLHSLRQAPLTVSPTGGMEFLQRRMVGHGRLSASVKAELEEELSRDDKTVCPNLPAGWTLNHPNGSNFFSMKKTFQDESIEMYCQLVLRDPEMVADKAGSNEHFPFTIVVSKGGKALDFTLSAIEGELVLDGIAFLQDAALARDMSADAMGKKDTQYPGPAVPELNDELVESFIAYLEERGVNDAFAEFVESYSFWMEQQEYEGWLSEVSEFTA